MAAPASREGMLNRLGLRTWWPWVILVVGLALTLLRWQMLVRSDQARLDATHSIEMNALTDRIGRRVEALTLVLKGASSHLAREPRPTRSEWRTYVERLGISASHECVQAMSFVPWIPRKNLPDHIRQVKEEGFPDYAIIPGGSLPPDPAGLSSIVYIEPMDARNQRAFGRDMWADPVRREAMIQSRDTGSVVLSRKLTLYQEGETGRQSGLVLYAPVYRSGFPLDTVAQRREALEGWATIVLRMGDFMASLLREETARMGIRLYEGAAADGSALLFDTGPSRLSDSEGLPRQQPIEAAGRTWLLQVQQNLDRFPLAGSRFRLEALVGGIIITLLTCGMAFLITGSERRAQALAEARGREILATEAQFRTLFEQAPMGMAIVDSGSGRFLSVNPRLGEILGYSPEALLERTFGDVTHPDHLKADLESLRDLVAGVTSKIQKEKRYVHQLGHVVWAKLSVVMLPVTEGKSPRHLALVEDITELRQVAEAIRSSEARFRTVSEWSPMPLFLHREGRFIYLNPAALHLLKAKADADLIGQPILDRIHVDDRERVQERVRFALRTGQEVPLLEERFIAVDGTSVEVEVLGRSIVYDGQPTMLVFAQDITARKQVLGALQESEAHFRGVVENAGDAIYLNDEEGRIFLCNRAACASLGYSMEELLHLRIGDFDPGYWEAGNTQARRSLKAGQKASILARHRRKDGTTFPVEVRISLLREEEPRQILAVVRDLTERQQVQEAGTRARKAESLVLMAGGIAHDFNNLFQALQGNLEIIGIRAKEDPFLVQPLSKAIGVLNRAISLSWKMLDFSGHGFVQLEWLSLESWLPAYLVTLKFEYPPAFQVDLACDPVPMIKADRSKLEQVIKTFLDNAHEAAGAQASRVGLRVYVDFKGDSPGPQSPGVWPLKRPDFPATVCLEVTDDGPGVPPEKLDLICDPFYTSRMPGRGLGLPAAVGILTAHGAGLHILNGAEKGLVLRVHFPPSGT